MSHKQRGRGTSGKRGAPAWMKSSGRGPMRVSKDVTGCVAAPLQRARARLVRASNGGGGTREEAAGTHSGLPLASRRASAAAASAEEVCRQRVKRSHLARAE